MEDPTQTVDELLAALKANDEQQKQKIADLNAEIEDLHSTIADMESSESVSEGDIKASVNRFLDEVERPVGQLCFHVPQGKRMRIASPTDPDLIIAQTPCASFRRQSDQQPGEVAQ